MANRNFSSQFQFSFEKQVVNLPCKITLTSNGARATLVNQAITYSAVAFGAAGNAVTIALLDPGLPSQALSVTVSGSAISVHLATDGGSLITSTATDVVAAIQASAAASALVTVSGSGLTALVALAATHLAGGLDAVFTNNMLIPFLTPYQVNETSYGLLLADKYYALISCQMMLMPAIAADLILQLISEDVASSKVIQFHALAGATPTLLSAGDSVYIDLLLRNVI